MKAFLITIAVIGGVFFYVMMLGSTGGQSADLARATPRSDLVTLHAPPGESIVQMFEKVGPGDAGNVTRFQDGKRCIKVNGPTPVSIEGISMHFYKLACDGTMGYVNAKWVR